MAALFHRLGFAAIIRDPQNAQVIAASPRAETELLAAQPGAVNMATARLGDVLVRVEVVRLADTVPIALTGRQTAVALLIRDGLRNEEIATRLGISSHTVRRHLEAIFRRLQVGNRQDAAEALRLGRVRL